MQKACEPARKPTQANDIRCPRCDRLLAKKIAPGRYESIYYKNRKKGEYLLVRTTVGEIRCPKCGHFLSIIGVPSRNQPEGVGNA